MKIVSDNLKNALKQPTTQRKGRILVDGNYYEVYNVEYYADAYLDGNVIGNAISSQLDFDLPYMDKFETFKYFDGVWTGNGYEYVDMGTFTVFDEQDEDEFNKHITAFDNLIKFNSPFNDIGGYPKTLFQELQNVCNQAGVNLQNMSITNGNFKVENNQFVNGESLKTVLKAICQMSGTYAIIKNDELILQLKNETNEIITKEQHEPVTWKRKTYGINQVVLGMSDVEGEYVLREDTQDIAQNGVHKLVINDNPFAYTEDKRAELIDELFNQVKGFGYVPFEMNCEWLNYLEVGDTVTIDDIETIILRISGKSPKSLESFMSAPAIIDSSVAYVNNTETVKNQLKRTEIIVDKNNQSIQSVVEQTEEQNQKIAQVTQTVEELNSKISDIADITTSAEDTDAKVEINEVNQSEPIRLVVRPIGESISNLLISSNMLISDNLKLKQRIIRFTNLDTNEIFDYELPADLLYYDSENYDEFILDYDGQSCVINKKVGYNTDGTTYILETPTTIEYDYPNGDNAVVLSDGNYIVEILGYDTGYIFARLMAKNIYTTQFYTKAETDSKISQTSQDITLGVDKKLSNYSTTTEMNSQIQLSASNITSNVSKTYATKNELGDNVKEINASLELKVNEKDLVSEINASADVINLKGNRITIDSDNFELTADGKITATAGDIGGFDLSKTNFASAVSGVYNYTIYDLRMIQAFILNYIHRSNILNYTLDANEDGTPNTLDMLRIQRILLGYDTSSRVVNAQFNINAQDPKNCLSITCNGETAVSLGASGINADMVAAKSFVCSKDDNIESAMTGVIINGETAEIRLIEELNEGDYTYLAPSGITTPTLTQTSKESIKKNFEKFSNGIDLIKNADIYSYNLKIEEDTDKKHIGLVINDLGGDYKTPEEVIDKNNEGIDLYSMVSISWQAIKEQQTIIEGLKKEIDILKKESDK